MKKKVSDHFCISLYKACLVVKILYHVSYIFLLANVVVTVGARQGRPCWRRPTTRAAAAA
jgi:hypothetical protein